jgi:hypothetical protein
MYFGSEMDCTQCYFGYMHPIYMKNFAYLCIMVWIHRDAHEYKCLFSKFEYFMYFWSTNFLVRFRFLGSIVSMTSLFLITLLVGRSNPSLCSLAILDALSLSSSELYSLVILFAGFKIPTSFSSTIFE